MGISFNGYDLQTGERITERTQQRTSPPKITERLKLVRRDGSKITNIQDDEKIIRVEGSLLTPTVSGFRGLLDEFKRELSATEKTLRITMDDGSVREYTASVMRKIELPREHFMTDYSPFRVDFLCADPYGYDETFTTVSAVNITTSPWTSTVPFSGSKEPVPVIDVFIGATWQLYIVNFKNTTTNQEIEVTRPATGIFAYSGGQQLTIDTNLLAVTLDNVPVSYSGVFPDFNLGSNDLELELFTFLGEQLDQFNDNSNNHHNVSRSWRVEQSFEAGITGDLTTLKLQLSKTLGDEDTDPDQPLIVTIFTDAAGKPNAPLSNSESVTAASLLESFGWVTINFQTPASVTDGVDYHIVLQTSATSDSGYYNVRTNTSNAYDNGVFKHSSDGGATWNTAAGHADMAFKTYVDGGGGSFDVNTRLSWKRRWR